MELKWLPKDKMVIKILEIKKFETKNTRRLILLKIKIPKRIPKNIAPL